jgi:hypothetical protein
MDPCAPTMKSNRFSHLRARKREKHGRNGENNVRASEKKIWRDDCEMMDDLARANFFGENACSVVLHQTHPLHSHHLMETYDEAYWRRVKFFQKFSSSTRQCWLFLLARPSRSRVLFRLYFISHLVLWLRRNRAELRSAKREREE